MTRGDRTRWRAVAAALVLPALAACSAGADDRPVVFAAASLGAPFEALAAEGGLDVDFSFAGSNALVDQLAGGARADVLATADGPTMDRAVAAGVVDGEPVRLATNHLVLVTPPDNPAGITGLDGSLDGARLVVCAPEVPCGRAAHAVADDAGVELRPVSEESGVTDVLGKVTSGEADAGLVYATDARAAGERVHTIAVPGAEEYPADYWIAAVAGGDAERAAAFIDLATSAEGRRVLDDHGFGRS